MFLLCFSVNAQNSIFGKWKTIDDKKGIEKSIVEVYEQDGKVYGKIVKLLDKSKGENPLCEPCPGDRKDQPVVGLQIIDGLTQDGDEWSGSKILDPENGKQYTCKIWLEDGNLKVRGYIAFLYRTQTWYRIE